MVADGGPFDSGSDHGTKDVYVADWPYVKSMVDP